MIDWLLDLCLKPTLAVQDS